MSEAASPMSGLHMLWRSGDRLWYVGTQACRIIEIVVIYRVTHLLAD